MREPDNKTAYLPAILFIFLWGVSTAAFADINSAKASMENQTNPLLKINTSKGEIFVELHGKEAPANVANFLALALGEIEFTDDNTGTVYKPRYFDGMTFHRVIPNFVIQSGSPHLNPLGAPAELLIDEISANSLNLDSAKVLLPDAKTNPLLNVTTTTDFAQSILLPLYQEMGIETPEEVLSRQNEITNRLQGMTVKQLYQLQGYEYSDGLTSRPIKRGTLALANTGPNSNGPEFFISLGNTEHLTGKFTAIGSVVEGLNVVDRIGERAINASKVTRASTVIFAVEKVN